MIACRLVVFDKLEHRASQGSRVSTVDDPAEPVCPDQMSKEAKVVYDDWSTDIGGFEKYSGHAVVQGVGQNGAAGAGQCAEALSLVVPMGSQIDIRSRTFHLSRSFRDIPLSALFCSPCERDTDGSRCKCDGSSEKVEALAGRQRAVQDAS